MYASQYLLELTELLRRLPRVLLLLLKTNDCLRAVDNALVIILRPVVFATYRGLSDIWYLNVENCRFAPQGAPINTFIITGRVSSRAVAEMEMQGRLSLWSRFKFACDRLSVEVRLLTLHLAALLLQAGNLFSRLFGRVL